MTHSIAVVGSGPGGFYATEALAKAGHQVDLFDRLPTPYGLVRSGVAPDHQGTKNVWRVYQRTAHRPEVRFLGNVEMGRDVSLAELRDTYDAVILAIGAPIDRELGIPGESLHGVIGSGPLTGWYNGHPDFSGFAPNLDSKGIAVIGNGNVAVDVVRVLCRTAAEMTKTDIPAYALEHIAAAPIADVYMIGRRGPLEASFTPVELRELGAMAGTVAVVDPDQLPEQAVATNPKDQKLKEKILDTLRGYSRNDPQSQPVRLHIMFYASPAEILGVQRVERLRLNRTKVENGKAFETGEQFDLEVGTVIRAIGYKVRPVEGIHTTNASSCYPNVEGRIDEGLWAVGWAKRGPSGVIATNRADSIAVIDALLPTLSAPPKADPRARIDALLRERGVAVVGFADWEKIEAKEAETEGTEAPRKKITSWDELRKTALS